MTRRKVGALLVPVILLLARLAGATDACVPPAGTSNLWCDITLSVTQTPVVVQSAPKGQSWRRYLQFQNNSAANGPSCVVCFGAAAKGVSCSSANGGTYLQPGQSMYRSSVGLYGGDLLNSLYFNSDISMVCTAAGPCTCSVSIDG